MKKLLLLFITLLLLYPSDIKAVKKKDLYSNYAYVYDGTSSQELLSIKGKNKIYPASMTKVMTVYISMLKIKNLDEQVKITKADVNTAWDASVANFEKNEVVTYRDLIYGALYPSGADACQALGRLCFGSLDNAVAQMNKTAKSLGMSGTHFVNTTGMHDDNHYSTCRDIAICLMNAYKIPEFKEIFNGKEYTTSNKKHTFYSTIERIYKLSGVKAKHVLGSKSGFTNTAGNCLASVFEVDHHDCFVVTANAKENKNLTAMRHGMSLTDTNTITTEIVKNYKDITILNKDELMKNIHVTHCFDHDYSYYSTKEIHYLIKKDQTKDDLKITYDIPDTLKAPIKKGKKFFVYTISDGINTNEYTFKHTKSFKYQPLAEIDMKIPFALIGLLLLLLIFIRIRISINKK